jgi:hypothetical protein
MTVSSTFKRKGAEAPGRKKFKIFTLALLAPSRFFSSLS